ncbi:methyl-accepting chemotaxis protein, partial [Rhizobium sp.]|uniref:methyl-accepting chemotaxis protein n=1 Tax=Rhizobium sp. TaxID=391 RepID=UPI000E98CD42|nr:methyl-accepting chemotaxis protein [Rhizobium sp.]
MLNNMKLSHKIYGGFSIIIIILIVTAGVNVFSNMQNQSYFTDYRDVARLTNEAGRIQANMLEARIAFLRFRNDPTAANVEGVHTRLATVDASSKTLIDGARTDAEKAAASRFAAAASQYKEGFKTVVAAQNEHDAVVETSLNILGPAVQKDVNAIADDLAAKGNTSAAYQTSDFLASIATMRLQTTKYLLNNNDESYKSAVAAGQDALSQTNAIKTLLVEAEMLARFQKVPANVQLYLQELDKTQKIVTKRNSVIEGVMNKLGPQLADDTENFKLGLKKEQDTLGPAIEDNMEDSVLTAEFLASVAIIVAATLSIFIARGISLPIRAMTDAMTKLANNQLEITIPGLDHKNEIGLMAKAVDVFKQNAIKIRQLAAQEAALQEKNADLQSNIATVVAAAVAGDFTARITKRYDNPDLDAFASNVNTLVASVDDGIAETKRVIAALSKGDLTETMDGHYQGVFADLQANVNDTMAALRELMLQVRQSADVINGGADEIRQASNDLSRRTETQAASLEETSSALEEITVAVKTSTERAQESSKMVTEARQFAETSANVVQDATAAMSRIEQASNEITQIINVIDEIAFQTNLLALNA